MKLPKEAIANPSSSRANITERHEFFDLFHMSIFLGVIGSHHLFLFSVQVKFFCRYKGGEMKFTYQ